MGISCSLKNWHSLHQHKHGARRELDDNTRRRFFDNSGCHLTVPAATLESGKTYPYVLHASLMSRAEFSFYRVLKQATGDAGVVFAKVRVADVLEPRKHLRRSDWQRAFNQVSAKHFDFLICDPHDSNMRIAVELDDASHNTRRAQKRDVFLAGACAAAELPLLRVTASNAYAIAALREQLVQLGLAGVPATDQPSHPVTRRSAGGSQDEETVPKCPKCGADAVLRKARSGPNSGRQFWGCSTYPKCRGVFESGT